MKLIEYWKTSKGVFIKTTVNGTVDSSESVDMDDEKVPNEILSGKTYTSITVDDNDPIPLRESQSKTTVLAADKISSEEENPAMVTQDEINKAITKPLFKEPTEKEETDMKSKKEAGKEESKDWVVSPNHYTQLKEELNGLECWDIYTILLRHKDYMPKHIAPLWANAFKYIWRVGDKPGDYGKTTEGKAIEDFEKVVAYCNKAISELKRDMESQKHQA